VPPQLAPARLTLRTAPSTAWRAHPASPGRRGTWRRIVNLLARHRMRIDRGEALVDKPSAPDNRLGFGDANIGAC